MECPKCNKPLEDTFRFCPYCGKALNPEPRTTKKRGNGQGSVFKLPNGKYKACVTVGYYLDETGKRHRRYKSKTFSLKKDAVAALATIGKDPEKEKAKTITFKELYDKWLPTHKAGKQTMGCYTAAVKHFADIYTFKITDIDIDDLQECVDNCQAGKRTRENMRALVSLIYKYGIPRHMIPENLNLAPFISVSGEASVHRESFTAEQIKKIRAGISKKIPYSDYIYCMIYTGFRPSEFLALIPADYNKAQAALIGGAKTDAGKGRTVTLSPKIKTLVDDQSRNFAKAEQLFPAKDGTRWRSLKDFTERAFYPALEACGIDNPIIEIAGGVKRHKYTPHSCRHTFSTLMKRIQAADKDKLELIGHTSDEMLRYYQDVSFEDLRKITDLI